MTVLEPQHADVMAALRDLMQHQGFTDFTIQLKEGSVFVSRIVTAALSPVFRNMLTTDMSETRTNKAVMDHITKETWTCIKEFYFGSQKLVTIDNVVDVLEASHMYELDKLTQYCCDFLQSVCSPDTCLGILRIATKLSLQSVAKKTSEVIAENFSAVCKCEDFLCLEESELLELLEKEELVTTEDDVCEALLAWMEAKDADADTCTELFQHIQMRRLSCECLGNRVLYHSALLRSPALQAKVQQEIRSRLHQSPYQRTTGAVRKRVKCDRDLYVVGVTGGKTCLYLWSCDEKWHPCPTLEKEIRGYPSSTLFENTIVLTDEGSNESTFLYDIDAKTWSTGPILLQPRKCHGMTVIRNKVYVVAGYTGGRLSSIEEFEMGGSQWSSSGSLKVRADECGVAALGNIILVAGGDTEESQSLIQTFNVETRKAAVLDVQLPHPMRHVRAASLGNTAFFVGSEGDLVQVTEVVGEFQMTSHVKLQGFENKKWFGLHVTDTCVRVMGGDQSQSVVCWNYQGQRVKNDEVGDLPRQMYVYGVHEVDYTSP